MLIVIRKKVINKLYLNISKPLYRGFMFLKEFVFDLISDSRFIQTQKSPLKRRQFGGEGGITQALPSPFGSPSLRADAVSRFALGSNQRGFSPSSFF
jgi:hypothetical protein